MCKLKKRFIILFVSTILFILSGCNNSTFLDNDRGIKTDNKNTVENKENVQSQSTSSVKDEKEKNIERGNDSTEKQNVVSKKKHSFFGEWRISKILAYAPVSENNENDMKSYIGKKFIYNDNLVQSGTNLCNKPFYKTSEISKDDFEAGNRMSFDELGINSQQITQINVFADQELQHEWDGLGNFFYMKDENVLIIYSGGCYFELKRIS